MEMMIEIVPHVITGQKETELHLTTTTWALGGLFQNPPTVVSKTKKSANSNVSEHVQKQKTRRSHVRLMLGN